MVWGAWHKIETDLLCDDLNENTTRNTDRHLAPKLSLCLWHLKTAYWMLIKKIRTEAAMTLAGCHCSISPCRKTSIHLGRHIDAGSAIPYWWLGQISARYYETKLYRYHLTLPTVSHLPSKHPIAILIHPSADALFSRRLTRSWFQSSPAEQICCFQISKTVSVGVCVVVATNYVFSLLTQILFSSQQPNKLLPHRKPTTKD